MRSLRNSDCGLVHVLGKFAVLAHRVCSFYIIRPCSSSLQRLKPTANFQRRESAASNRARRATLNFFLRFFFFIKLFIPQKSRSSWRLGSSKGKLKGPGPASGTSLLGAGQRNAARVTNPVLPIASPAGAESNFLTRLKCFFQPPPAEPVR